MTNEQILKVVGHLEAIASILRKQVEDPQSKPIASMVTQSVQPEPEPEEEEDDTPKPPPSLQGPDEGIFQLGGNSGSEEDDEYDGDDLDTHFRRRRESNHKHATIIIQKHVIAALMGEDKLERGVLIEKIQIADKDIPEWRIYRVVLKMDKDRLIEPVTYKPKSYRATQRGIDLMRSA